MDNWDEIFKYKQLKYLYKLILTDIEDRVGSEYTKKCLEKIRDNKYMGSNDYEYIQESDLKMEVNLKNLFEQYIKEEDK